jgi:hypothetical protein
MFGLYTALALLAGLLAARLSPSVEAPPSVLGPDPHGVFQAKALLCTDLEAAPLQILSWFVLQWRVEATFHDVRAHLGVGTQRHWSDRAIARTTSALLGLFSLVTRLAHPSSGRLLTFWACSGCHTGAGTSRDGTG